MAEFAAPSFSLGLDFDLDFDPPSGGATDGDALPESTRPDPAGGGSSVSATGVRMRGVEKDEDDADFDLPRPPDPVPVFKRLKKGPPSTRRSPPPAVAMNRGYSGGNEGGRGFNRFDLPNADDDIEEFSSQEDCRMLDTFALRKNPSTCSSSKISLHGCKILTSQSSSKAEVINSNTLTNAPLTQNLEASCSKKMLPKLTVSPLRKIQFLDSDSDDASLFHEDSRTKRADSSCKVGSSSRSCSTTAQEKANNVKLDKTPSVCLWKDYLTTNNSNLATPALDDFCKEYFSTSRNKKTSQASSGVCFHDNFVHGSESYQHNQTSTREEPHWDLPDPQPPAYQYFFHDDTRIRELVRLRLCNFIPLGSPLHQGSQQCDADSLDYMCQFGPKAAPVRISSGTRKTSGKTSGKSKTKTNRNAGEPSSSGNWVNPRNPTDYPKDAGKRRVSVDSCSSGHWYTGQDGRKVYVTKNGQELSGQAAYRHYRKESGGRFRKTKKKAIAKKTKRKR